MRIGTYLGLAVLAVASLVVGCGGDEGNECGSGTVAMGGACVPTSEACGDGTTFDEAMGRCVAEVACAEGTVPMGGECVPDGSVVCGGGTTFDETSGTCVPDLTSCAEGTVMVGGECVPFDDTLVGDVHEAAEPNDLTLEAGAPAMFDLPAVGADPVTIDGCVTPDDFDGNGTVDPDMDSFSFEASGPTVIDVTVDGKGGLSAGFIVLAADNELADDSWIRFGIDLVSDGASRKIFVPQAGTYVINVGDSRALFVGEPAGGMDTCYFMQVGQEEIPAPIPLDGTIASGTFGDPVIYSLTGSAAQLLFATVADGSEAAGPAIVGMVDGEYRSSNTSQADEANLALGGFADGDEIWLVVEPTLDYALADVEYELETTTAAAPALPDDGTINFTHEDGLYQYGTFEATAGEIVRFSFSTAGDDLRVRVIDPRLRFVVANLCGGCTTAETWIQIVQGGTYFVQVYNDDGVEGADYAVGFQRTHITPTGVTTGTAVAGSLGTDVDRAFFAFDATGEDWLEYALGSFGGSLSDAVVRVYPRDAEGSLGGAVDAIDVEIADATAYERIYAGDVGPVLIAITDADTVAGDETFDLTVRQVDFQDLGTIAAGASAARSGEMVEAGAVTRYLARTDEGNLFNLTVTGAAGVDVVVELLDREAQVIDVLDAAAAGEAETVTDLVPNDGVVAFRVRESGGAAGEYDLQLDALGPPYEVTVGTEPFVDICPAAGGAGVVHGTVDDGFGFGADDDGLSATPLDVSALGFEHFGTSVTEATVSTNGWITFEASYAGDSAYVGTLPDTDTPNSVLAPFWRDLIDVEVCTLSETDRIVVQWQGAVPGFFSSTPVQFQAILHDDDSVDIVYGPDHMDDGALATIGLENAAGDYAVVWEDTVADEISLTFTPR